MIAAIQESLARKVPPISFGILGPPEAGGVTGYDQGGAAELTQHIFTVSNQCLTFCQAGLDSL